MILTCEACHTNYMVKPDAIGPQGRQVRCVKCGHEWLQMPVSDDATVASVIANEVSPAPKAVEPVPQGSALPVVKDIQPAPLWLKLLPFPLALCTLAFYAIIDHSRVIVHYPGLTSVYEAIGLEQDMGVVLSDVKLVKLNVEKNARPAYVLQWKMRNDAEVDKVLPSVEVSLLDEQKDSVYDLQLTSPGTEIKPGQSLEFKHRLTDMDASYVRLDIGSKIALMLH